MCVLSPRLWFVISECQRVYLCEFGNVNSVYYCKETSLINKVDNSENCRFAIRSNRRRSVTDSKYCVGGSSGGTKGCRRFATTEISS